MTFGVSEGKHGVVISMTGRVRPNEHLWLRRALVRTVAGAVSVVCDLAGVARLGEPELFLLAMIRREVEQRGGRLVLRSPGPAERVRLRRFGLIDVATGGDAC